MTAMKRDGIVWPKVLLGMVGGAAAIWIILASLGAAGTREWEEYAASLRAKGQPITFDEIEARRTVIPNDQNSALIVESLADSLTEQRASLTIDGVTSGSNKPGDFFTGIKQGRIEPAREFLSKHQDILTKLTALRDKPTGRFTIQYDRNNPLATMIPHVAQLRTVSKLVRLNTTVQLVDGDLPGAHGGFELQCRLAGARGDEPMLISRLVQIAIQAQAIATAEDMLRVGATDDQALKRMANELQIMRNSGSLKWALLGERAFFVETCESVAAGRVPLMQVVASVEDQAALFFTQPLRRLPAFLMRSNQLRGARMHTSLIEVADDPKALFTAAKKIEDDLPKLPRTQILVKILMPSLTRAVLLNTRSQAQLDCAIAALAAERFRLTENRFPATLDELVPKYLPTVPIDPFGGKPLRMAQTQGGIVVYSVDENGIDDGGDIVSRKVGVRNITPDMGFRLNDVAHRGVVLVDDPPVEDD